ncbi:deoxyribodipyrimidine photo-lyase [Dinoroseobacter sp. S375]|uniref:deoxyribodipyrimidine photo-lyase n=1 Tax=Dinoroseobacter sp. S375 TaxID=3415136 RepID=UPI003C7B3432
MPDWSSALAARVRPLNPVPVRDAGAADYVLCWLQQTLRAHDNPAIDAAIDLGNQLGLPVLVYHGVREDYPYASDRLHAFLLGASRDLQQGCRARGLRAVSFIDRATHREKGLVYRLAEQAAAVLTDDHPVYVARAQATRFAARAQRAVFAIDTARLVPSQAMPDGLTTTPSFRKAHGALRAEFEAHDSDFDSAHGPYSGPVCFAPDALADASDAEIARIIAACGIDHSLPPCPEFPPTAAAAQAALDQFIAASLKNYPYRRNNPADETGVSRLSPYLHFGVIGPRRITAAVRAADLPANAKWKYLDELLTWREYFHYLAYRSDAPDSFATVPERPRRSLLDHASDPRPTLYTLNSLLHGQTDDETWNAAQKQWLETGYMHNNLRMYWGKQIIRWTRDPETAWKTACYLNDRLSLDGRDPATYGNMRWVFGMSKPAYREQPIYGWVPPKSDRALRKRDGAAAWLADWAQRETLRIDVPEGLPHELL